MFEIAVDYGLVLIDVFDIEVFTELSRPLPDPLRFLTGYIKEAETYESSFVVLYVL